MHLIDVPRAFGYHLTVPLPAPTLNNGKQMNAANMFANIPARIPSEIIERIVHSSAVTVERIVSPRGHASPGGFWYDGGRSEWVLVLKGGAGVLYEGVAGPRLLSPGDHLIIPAHVRHRVDWTDPDRETVWLAVYY
jgi:cupin 2 domain-containing protein